MGASPVPFSLFICPVYPWFVHSSRGANQRTEKSVSHAASDRMATSTLTAAEQAYIFIPLRDFQRGKKNLWEVSDEYASGHTPSRPEL